MARRLRRTLRGSRALRENNSGFSPRGLPSRSLACGRGVGRTYFVFLRGGSVVYPGGIYAEADGRVWYIGDWDGPDSRTYAPGLSGLSAMSALAIVKEAHQ